MPLGWRRFAKVAEREAYSEDEMSHTLRDALEADWQNCIPESLMRMVGDVLSGEQTDFLRDQRTELLDLLRKEDPGQSLRITFLDHVVHSVTNGYFGKEALVDAAQCTLVDHAQRGARQVKEHYHRKATQGHPVAIGRRIQRAAELLVWCLTNTLMKMRGHFGRRQGVLRLRCATLRTSSGGYHARKSNAADGQKDPQIRKRICETPH